MRYVIELWFDDALERAVVEVWQRVQAAGVRSIIHPEEGRPHLSLAIFEREGLAPHAAIPLLEAHFANASPFEVLLTGWGTFQPSGVWFLTPASSAELLCAHDALHTLIRAHAWETDPLYTPGRWTPHCTVAQEVPSLQEAGLLDILRHTVLPLSGRVCGVQLVQVYPDATIWERSFT